MRAWRLAWRTACGFPVFRELEEASAGMDRGSVRLGRRAARRGDPAPDAASARVPVARARAMRAGVPPDAEHGAGQGWRIAQLVVGVLWLALAVVDAVDGDPDLVWHGLMGICFVVIGARSPRHRCARARQAEARNRAVLREHGVVYPANDDTVYLRPPVVAAVVATAVLAAVYAATFVLLVCLAEWTLAPQSSDVLFGAALGLALTTIWAVLGWRRADPYAEPPDPVGL